MGKPLENRAQHQAVRSCQGIPGVALQEIPDPRQSVQQDRQLFADSVTARAESGVPTHVLGLACLQVARCWPRFGLRL